MKKNILLAGGCGFIGKNIIEQYKNKHELLIIDKDIDINFCKKNNTNYKSIDVSNKKTLLELKNIIIDFKPDIIFNLISIVTASRDLTLFPAMVESNLNVLLNFYEALKENNFLDLFIQFGSGEEYGNIKAPFKATDREEPNSPYALIKQLTTNTALMLYRNYGFPIVVIRPTNLLGKYQSEDKFIPYITKKLKNNEELNVTRCEQKRNFIDVVEFIKKLESIIKNKKKNIGKIINIGSGKAITLKKIIEEKKKTYKSSSIINYGAIPYRKSEIMDFRLEIDHKEFL